MALLYCKLEVCNDSMSCRPWTWTTVRTTAGAGTTAFFEQRRSNPAPMSCSATSLHPGWPTLSSASCQRSGSTVDGMKGGRNSARVGCGLGTTKSLRDMVMLSTGRLMCPAGMDTDPLEGRLAGAPPIEVDRMRGGGPAAARARRLVGCRFRLEVEDARLLGPDDA